MSVHVNSEADVVLGDYKAKKHIRTLYLCLMLRLIPHLSALSPVNSALPEISSKI